MKLNKLHIKFLGFVLLLAAMFVLNNNLEKSASHTKSTTETTYIIDSNITATSPINAQVPDKTAGSLPFKLITNLNSDFLNFINHGYEFRNQYHFIFLKNYFLEFYHKIQQQKLISYLITAQSKDIQ